MSNRNKSLSSEVVHMLVAASIDGLINTLPQSYFTSSHGGDDTFFYQPEGVVLF